MFLRSRPTQDTIEGFLEVSQGLPFSYQLGVLDRPSDDFTIDEAVGILGRGAETFERAKVALANWRHFDLGWVELFPPDAPIVANTVVVVLIRHLRLWSLNGCRLLKTTGDRDGGTKFGFAYGTLTNHAEMGEELFEVEMNPQTGDVTYRIRAASKPRAFLARVGYPVTRSLQARFRRDSIAAMQRADRI